MKRSCVYCGGIHDRSYVCPSKPKYKRIRDDSDSESRRLRQTSVWKKRSVEIRRRDKGLCQFCFRNIYHTTNQYTFDDVSVHHIKPLNEGGSLLSGHNLITVCRMHHEMCERGDIPRQAQQHIAKEQERINKI